MDVKAGAGAHAARYLLPLGENHQRFARVARASPRAIAPFRMICLARRASRLYLSRAPRALRALRIRLCLRLLRCLRSGERYSYCAAHYCAHALRRTPPAALCARRRASLSVCAAHRAFTARRLTLPLLHRMSNGLPGARATRAALALANAATRAYAFCYRTQRTRTTIVTARVFRDAAATSWRKHGMA